MNYVKLLAQLRAGYFCTAGHHYCPCIRDDGAIIFASGLVRPDGRFFGSLRLRQALEMAQSQELPTWGGCPAQAEIEIEDAIAPRCYA